MEDCTKSEERDMEFPRTKITESIILPSTGEHDVRAHNIKRLDKKNELEKKDSQYDDSFSYEENLRHWGIELG